MSIFTFLMIIFISTGVMAILGDMTKSEGLEFVNPIWLYKEYKVNWFGAGFIGILLTVLTLPYSIFYWIYKLCTVGRK